MPSPKLFLENHILLHDKRVGLLLVPKCAASSIRQSIKNSDYWYAVARSRVPASYHRIGIVRNTWDRLVSCWYQKTKSYWRVPQLRNDRFKLDMSLRDFVAVVAHDIRANAHYYPQDEIVGECDEIWRLSDLRAEWERRFPDIELMHVNGSDREHYAEYYDAELQDVVGDLYAAEIKRFGFTF